MVMDWSNSGAWLAVAGKVSHAIVTCALIVWDTCLSSTQEREIARRSDHTFKYVNSVKFFTEQGNLLYRAEIRSDNVHKLLIIFF